MLNFFNIPINILLIPVRVSFQGIYHLFNKFRYGQKGPLTEGEWWAYIPNHPDGPMRDRLTISHFGETVWAHAKRIEPADKPLEAGRTWKFLGHYRDRLLFLHFWANPPKQMPSDGIIELAPCGLHFHGSYWRFNRNPADGTVTPRDPIIRIGYHWYRSDDFTAADCIQHREASV